MARAYSYFRFSTAKQKYGSSIDRQMEKSIEYVKNHGLELDTELNMSDEGVSGYKSKNLYEGRLGEFVGAVENGIVKKGSYLLIENMDRLSRDRIEIALGTFLRILNLGIIIVTLKDNRVYKSGELKTEDLLISILEMIRANEESVRKGELVTKGWQKSKSKVVSEGKKLTKWSARWLKLSDDRTHFVADTKAVKTIKKIFDLAESGLGASLTIQRLEQDGNEIIYSGNIDYGNRKRAKRWHISMVQRILTNRAVIGEYVLKNGAEDGRDLIVKDYFEKVIDEEQFYRVQALRKKRNASNQGGGRKGKYYSNLFAKIAICGYSIDDNYSGYRCSGRKETMVYINKGENSKYKYLQCNRVKEGNNGCKKCKRMWRYDDFESIFIQFVSELDIKSIIGNKDDLRQDILELESNKSELEGKIVVIEKETNKIEKSILEDGFSKTLRTILDNYEQKLSDYNLTIDAIQQEIDTKESISKNTISTVTEINKLLLLLGSLSGQELFDLRLKISEMLKSLIARIEVYSQGNIVDLDLIKAKYGQDAYEVMKKNEKQTENFISKYFVVVFMGSRFLFIFSCFSLCAEEVLLEKGASEESNCDFIFNNVRF